MRGFLLLAVAGLLIYWMWKQGWIHSLADIPAAIGRLMQWLGAKLLSFFQALFGGLARGVHGLLPGH